MAYIFSKSKDFLLLIKNLIFSVFFLICSKMNITISKDNEINLLKYLLLGLSESIS